MTALCFVDTNVLVYSRDSSEPGKQPRAQAWREALWRTRQGRISAQILNEYYQVVTRKLSPGLPVGQARADVHDLEYWQPVALTTPLMRAAFEVEDRWQLSFWDALVVAAAQHSGCSYLLSEDFQHQQDLDGLVILDPFRTAPEEILEPAGR